MQRGSFPAPAAYRHKDPLQVVGSALDYSMCPMTGARITSRVTDQYNEGQDERR